MFHVGRQRNYTSKLQVLKGRVRSCRWLADIRTAVRGGNSRVIGFCRQLCWTAVKRPPRRPTAQLQAVQDSRPPGLLDLMPACDACPSFRVHFVTTLHWVNLPPIIYGAALAVADFSLGELT